MLYIRDALESGAAAAPAWEQLDASKKLIVVTAHRRESFGEGFERICRALARLAERPDVQIAYPVHRNPQVMDPVLPAAGRAAEHPAAWSRWTTCRSST